MGNTLIGAASVVWEKFKNGKNNDSAEDIKSQRFQSYSANRASELCTSYPQQESSKTLDLHDYHLETAMSKFKKFLASSMEDYRRSNYSGEHRFVNIITGRGNHSENNIPVIKREVKKYLKMHNSTYRWSNSGMVTIDLMGGISYY